MNNYNANNIKSLDYFEHIRKYPGMYIGSKDEKGLLHCVKEIISNSIDEYLNLLKSSDKQIILIARPTCGYCEKFTPILKQAMEDMNLTINYVNTDNFSSDDWTKFQSSFDYLASDEWGTPLTLVVQDGKIVDTSNGYVELDAIKEFFAKNGLGK